MTKSDSSGRRRAEGAATSVRTPVGARDGFAAELRLVHEALERAASRHPDKTALVCGDARVTYAELDASANRVANGLVDLGVHPGDRVMLFLENSVEAVTGIFGVLKAGAAFTVVSPSTKTEKLGRILSDERAAALMTVNDRLRRRAVEGLGRDDLPPTVVWAGGSPGSRVGDHDWSDLLARAPDCPPALDIDDATIGTIIYTSGTTGTPKGVVSLHRDMVFAAQAIVTYLEQSDDDVVFSPLPLAFTYGLYQLITAVFAGATLVLAQNFMFPQQALEVMQRERVTGVPGVPTMFRLLVRLGNLHRYDLGSLRYLTNAAAPLPTDLLHEVRRAFPQARLYSMYGQTECKRACYLPPEELDRRPDSVGVPIPGTEAFVVDEDGNLAPPGVTGELVVAGPHLMAGYWGRPEETAAVLRRRGDGRVLMHTGDLFYRDEEGFLYFVSRVDDVIKTRGEKVSPHEIERVLRDLPGVLDAVAVGVPDDMLGQAVKVFIVAEEGSRLTERTVKGFCLERLEELMVPRHVEFRQELPISENGKTLRKELRSCVA